MSRIKTEQEVFWAGEFGDKYIERNKSAADLASNAAFFARIFAGRRVPASAIEFGSNIGQNLKALKILFPEIELSAIELNETAVKELASWGGVKTIYPMSILDCKVDVSHDLAFTKGVLIHINPAELHAVYERLYQASTRYIMLSEYYSPFPVEVRYRGHDGKLFKRDFAGELLDRYKDVELVDYGFVYHRDPSFVQDDMTWFLMEKR